LMGRSLLADTVFNLVASLGDVQGDLRQEHHRALEPITVFVDSMLPVQKRMVDILPPRSLCDRLLGLYLSVSEGLFRVIHALTFEQEYTQFWDGKGCNDSFLPRLLCILCIAARFGTDSRGLSHDRYTTIHIPTACVLVRHWLHDWRRDDAVDPAALETELLLLFAQTTIHPERQTSWAQLGYVTRMAMAMGLNHDPSEVAGLSELNRECRRSLWFTIVEMDLHMSLTYDLPCTVKPGEYSCRPPRPLPDDISPPPNAQRPPEPRPDRSLQTHSATTLPARLQAATLSTHPSPLTLTDHNNPVLTAGAALSALLDDLITGTTTPLHNHHHPAPSSGSGSSSSNNRHTHRNETLLALSLHLPLIALYRPFVLASPSSSSHFPTNPTTTTTTTTTTPHPHPDQQLHTLNLTLLKSCVAVLGYSEDLDPAADDDAGEVAAVYHAVLRRGVVEAAFGVCWFIREGGVGNGGVGGANGGVGNGSGVGNGNGGVGSSVSSGGGSNGVGTSTRVSGGVAWHEPQQRYPWYVSLPSISHSI
jgi:uncharacterized membrane protein YgcG